jgi:hypothetical protein
LDSNEVGALFVVCVTIGTVSLALLRPIAKQLARLLEAMALERSRPLPPPDVERVRELLETLHARLDRLEERQDFTDSLLAGGQPPQALGLRRSPSEGRVPGPRPGSHEG